MEWDGVEWSGVGWGGVGGRGGASPLFQQRHQALDPDQWASTRTPPACALRRQTTTKYRVKNYVLLSIGSSFTTIVVTPALCFCPCSTVLYLGRHSTSYQIVLYHNYNTIVLYLARQVNLKPMPLLRVRAHRVQLKSAVILLRQAISWYCDGITKCIFQQP